MSQTNLEAYPQKTFILPRLTGTLKTIHIIIFFIVFILFILLGVIFYNVGYNKGTATPATTTTPSVTTSPQPTINGTLVIMEEFRAEITIPNNWSYSKTENMLEAPVGGYSFMDQTGDIIFELMIFDGGVLENYCHNGSFMADDLQINGQTESIQSCYINGTFSRTYSMIDDDRFALDMTIPLNTLVRQILGTITNTGDNPNLAR